MAQKYSRLPFVFEAQGGEAGLAEANRAAKARAGKIDLLLEARVVELNPARKFCC